MPLCIVFYCRILIVLHYSPLSSRAHLQVLVNKEVGFWLARILYTHNPAKSDSAKIPGMMELLRVQVSANWGVCDVCDGSCGGFSL
jgi:hypothetical protein